MGTKFPEDCPENLSFIAEYSVPNAAYTHHLVLKYYPANKEVSLYDTDLKRSFLSRITWIEGNEADLHVGSTVFIYGRNILIIDYADKTTKDIVSKLNEHTITVIKPDAINILGDILIQIEKRNFTIAKLKMIQFNKQQALQFYKHQRSPSEQSHIIEHIVSGPSVVLDLKGLNALERWNQEVGPIDPVEAKRTAPNSIRAIYGITKILNVVDCATTLEKSIEDASFFFPEGTNEKSALVKLKLLNSTCCVIKPHAISEGKLGYIIKVINESIFKINVMQLFYLNEPDAIELLEVYNGVVCNFYALVKSFLCGPCIAMEIVSNDPNINVHSEFRKFCGPSDSMIARQIRPYTIRGRFGVDKFNNAVHCTDLPEDTVLELEYFFKILNKGI